jgi:hypothetical protein
VSRQYQCPARGKRFGHVSAAYKMKWFCRGGFILEKAIKTTAALLLAALFLFAAGCGSATYEAGSDTVPSVTDVVGSRKLSEKTSVEDGSGSLIYQYTNVEDPAADVKAYEERLLEEGFTELIRADYTSPSGLLQMGRNSQEEGKIFVVTVSYYDMGYDVQVDLAEGRIPVSE